MNAIAPTARTSTTSDHHGRYQPLVAGERRGTADERGTACCGRYGGGTAGRDTAAAVRGWGRTGCGAGGLLATGGRDGWTGCPAGACGRWRVWSMRPVSSISTAGARSVRGLSLANQAVVRPYEIALQHNYCPRRRAVRRPMSQVYHRAGAALYDAGF